KSARTASCGRVGFFNEQLIIDRGRGYPGHCVRRTGILAIVRKHVAAKVQQLGARRPRSPELKAHSESYETDWKRTNRPISSVDPLLSYNFRASLCSWRAYRSCEWVAIVKNSLLSDRLHGVRADCSDAFQPAC